MKKDKRLIVALDFDPLQWSDNDGAWSEALALVEQLAGMPVIIKVNSILSELGLQFVDFVHENNLSVFVDGKFNDIPQTMRYYARFLKGHVVELATAMCSAGDASLRAFKEELPDVETLGVTVLSSLTEDECMGVYGATPDLAVQELARIAREAAFDGLVCSGHEVAALREAAGRSMTLNAVGIRPSWSIVNDDDQKRVVTPSQAIKNGATRIIVGRPIIQAENPRDVVKRILEEINQAL